MQKKISIGVALILIVASILVTFQITFVFLNGRYQKALDEVSVNMAMYQKLAQVDAIYRNGYIGELDDERLMDGVIAGYILGTGDKYAYYLDKESYAEMQEDSSAEMVGIGVRVGVAADGLRVVRIMENSPAEAAGILKDDLITKVDGLTIAGMSVTEAAGLVKGTVNTATVLTIKRGEEIIEISVIRRKFQEESVIYRHLDADNTVGVVRIIQFDAGTAEQFINACETLSKEGATRFIFDVRANAGGNLDAICGVLDFLLPEGPIIHIEDSAGNRETIYSDGESFDWPMCVLVNGETASAAELFASALRDYEKAELVGTLTYGKGTVQSVISLPDGSGFAFSKSLYYPPYSDLYEGIGITPDHVVEMDEASADISLYDIMDSEDNQLQYAVSLLGSKE